VSPKLKKKENIMVAVSLEEISQIVSSNREVT
jgi:hypothetical protein